MKPYVFQKRKGVYILDLKQTIPRVEEAVYLVIETVKNGGNILFVGTKTQARETIQECAERCNMPYMIQRWPGGFLTNWAEISPRLGILREHLKSGSEEKTKHMTKREKSLWDTKIGRMERLLGGAVELESPPDLLFLADVHHDRIAVDEAVISGVGVIGILDTNCNPDGVTVGIPGNDDAVGSISLLAGKIADAVVEGLRLRESGAGEEEPTEPDEIPLEDDKE